MAERELIIVGGANGAGKTTFAVEYASRYGCLYLGPTRSRPNSLRPHRTLWQSQPRRNSCGAYLLLSLTSGNWSSNLPLPDAHSNIRCTVHGVLDSRSRLYTSFWIPLTCVWNGFTNACSRVAIQFLNSIFGGVFSAVIATFGRYTDRWRITGC